MEGMGEKTGKILVPATFGKAPARERERERASSWDQTFQTSEVEILAQNQLQTGPLPSHSSQRDDFFFYSSHLML
jgi:hypothetical protein